MDDWSYFVEVAFAGKYENDIIRDFGKVFESQQILLLKRGKFDPIED